MICAPRRRLWSRTVVGSARMNAGHGPCENTTMAKKNDHGFHGWARMEMCSSANHPRHPCHPWSILPLIPAAVRFAEFSNTLAQKSAQDRRRARESADAGFRPRLQVETR